ncbi:hypothetical protein RND81_09G051000 [Saponaria officinalis]|uniref:Protein FAR1-RELATED SEQUENCE n=1 Tax=Saponaria officinalis TaxID=3572 RepID=A0AAW1IIX2_SAPOF
MAAINDDLFNLNEDYDQEIEVDSNYLAIEVDQNDVEEIESNAQPPSLVEQAVNLVEGTTFNNEEISESAVGMTFANCDSFAAFCFTYALKKGFELFTRSNKLMDQYKEAGAGREFGGNKEPRYYMMCRLRLACKKGGRKRSEKANVTDCKVCFEAAAEGEVFVIKSCHLEHSHDLDPENSRFTVSARVIGEYFKKRIMLNDRAGIPITKNFNAMVMEAGGHENLPFNRRDLRNFVNLERQLERLHRDAAALEEYFVKMKIDNPDFFYAIKKDSDGRLQNVFWADARCRAMFKAFGDVVTYDTTFLCNRYRLPFSPFIGENHHGNSISFASALITNEDTDTFVWVFKRWLKCMGKAPPVILSDKDKAIGKAIETVFPGTPHRLCLWHMMKNAVKNLGRYKFWKEHCSDLKFAVHYILGEDEFEQAWNEMVDKYGIYENPWTKEPYNIRRRWVPCYLRGTFCAGLSSSQRSEQTNRFFIVPVSLETGLRNFITQFELAQQSRVEEEKHLNFICKDRPLPYDKSVLVEEVFSKRYTNEKFKEVKEQVYAGIHTFIELKMRIGSYVLYKADDKIVEPF